MYCFFLLFFVYYVISVYSAAHHIRETWGDVVLSVALAIYVAFGVWFAIFLVNQVRYATSTSSGPR